MGLQAREMWSENSAEMHSIHHRHAGSVFGAPGNLDYEAELWLPRR